MLDLVLSLYLPLASLTHKYVKYIRRPFHRFWCGQSFVTKGKPTSLDSLMTTSEKPSQVTLLVRFPDCKLHEMEYCDFTMQEIHEIMVFFSCLAKLGLYVKGRD
jgi:hypothetical protein